VRVEDIVGPLWSLCCALPFALPLIVAWLAGRRAYGILEWLAAFSDSSLSLFLIGAAAKSIDAKEERKKKNLGIKSVLCAAIAFVLGGAYGAFCYWAVTTQDRASGIPGAGPIPELVVAGFFLVIPMLTFAAVGYVYGKAALDASRKNRKKRAWALAGVILNLIVLVLPPIGVAVFLLTSLRR